MSVVVPAGVFKTGLDARVFTAIHFLKAYDDNYTFDIRPTYGGFLKKVTSKFSD